MRKLSPRETMNSSPTIQFRNRGHEGGWVGRFPVRQHEQVLEGHGAILAKLQNG
jgi:hypothetical protein